jgi:hypothetical protein
MHPQSSTSRLHIDWRRAMALHNLTNVRDAAADHELIRAFVIVIAIVALMLIATAVFGVQGAGPSYEIVSDPAGVELPF